VGDLVAGQERADVEHLPLERHHHHLHRGHLVEVVLPQDRPLMSASNIARFSFTATAPRLRERARALEADGVTELAVQPGGDVPDGLRRPARALI
jgi:hypothetical protein